jgi:anaerobic magnesium-protoporphyrin IX monomethyl ester cyclase
MKIQRIMLIRPGLRFSRMVFAQPLGLLYLVSVLRRDFPGEFEIELTEQALEDLSLDEMRARIKRFDPDLIGFSCLSVEADEMQRVAQAAKEVKPGCVTVLGGPHATVFFDYALNDPNLDLVVLNEGEVTFPELLRALRDDRPLDQVAGIAFKREGRVVQTPTREHVPELDALPLPAWDLIDWKRYAAQVCMNTYSATQPWAVIFTSRACPYQCTYCHSIFGKKVRYRSVENVMAEIELLTKNYGVRELHIVDDIFNLDLERAKRICDEIVARGIKVKIAFPNGLRGDRMDRELIHKLKLAGCYAITYAVETASPRLQKLIKKNLDLDRVREAIAWTYEEGIIPQAFLMLGFPGETPEEMKMSVDFTVNSKLLRAIFFTVVIYPRTGLFDLARREYPNFDFSRWNMLDLWYASATPFYTKATGMDMFKVQRDAYRRFFFRPKTLAMILWRFPKNMFFFRGIYWGLRNSFVSLLKLEPIFRPLRKFLSRHGIFYKV